MSEHTPGPWAAERCEVTPCFHIEAGAYPYGTSVCRVEENPRDGSAKANARLIVAAPDLAAFIRTIANMTQDGESLADAVFFTMKPEDAVQTVNLLIDQARKLEKKAGLA